MFLILAFLFAHLFVSSAQSSNPPSDCQNLLIGPKLEDSNPQLHSHEDTAPPATESVKFIMASAKHDYDDGLYLKSLRQINQVLDADPNDIKALALKSRILLTLGYLREAYLIQVKVLALEDLAVDRSTLTNSLPPVRPASQLAFSQILRWLGQFDRSKLLQAMQHTQVVISQSAKHLAANDEWSRLLLLSEPEKGLAHIELSKRFQTNITHHYRRIEIESLLRTAQSETAILRATEFVQKHDKPVDTKWKRVTLALRAKALVSQPTLVNLRQALADLDAFDRLTGKKTLWIELLRAEALARSSNHSGAFASLVEAFKLSSIVEIQLVGGLIRLQKVVVPHTKLATQLDKLIRQVFDVIDPDLIAPLMVQVRETHWDALPKGTDPKIIDAGIRSHFWFGLENVPTY